MLRPLLAWGLLATAALPGLARQKPAGSAVAQNWTIVTTHGNHDLHGRRTAHQLRHDVRCKRKPSLDVVHRLGGIQQQIHDQDDSDGQDMPVN